MHATLMMSWSLFPPQTKDAQLDERWSFVFKKEAHCDPEEDECGDNWDHTAIDPESRLLLALVCGKRSAAHCVRVVNDVKRRTGGRTDILFTSDEYAPYKTAIEKAYANEVQVPKRNGPGRPPGPRRIMPDDLGYATVHKTRKNGRVVRVTRNIVFGDSILIEEKLKKSVSCRTINTAFVERNNGTERTQNSRKVRKTYGFSKKWDVHIAVSYFTGFSYNFCWPVRTLRKRDSAGRYLNRTPAMAAGLTDHIWSVYEWITFPTRKAVS